MPQVTLQDIAERVGVSHTTVSRVLSGHPRISEKVGRQVQQAARDLGYRPQQRGRRSRAKACVLIVLCSHGSVDVHELQGSFRMMMIHGAMEAAELHSSLDCRLTYLSDSSSQAQRRAKRAELSQADGLIVMGHPQRELVESMRESRPEMVLADEEMEHEKVDCVVSDNVQGGRLAARHLIERGFERVGLFTGEGWPAPWTQRLDGARLELVRRGLALHPEDDPRADRQDFSSLEQAVHRWLEREGRPGAVITPSGDTGLAVARVARDRGVRIPRDLSLVCFDNQISVRMIEPEPTRVATFPGLIGRKAVQRMLQRIALAGRDERPDPPHKLVIPLELIEGRSVREPVARPDSVPVEASPGGP